MLRRQLSLMATSSAVLILMGLCFACTADEASTPELRPISPATVAVNETLRLTLTVDNPSGVSLEYSFAGPDLPGLTEVTDLAGTTSGAEFRWTPLASHVGTHELIFQISSRFGSDSESVLITVEPAASAAPIFLRPGAGGTYELSRDPCVGFDVEVRDDDSSSVDIRLLGTPPDGASLFVEGPKQARFNWCPTADQTGAGERWTIELEADDGDHLPTKHNYLVVLRTEARENCTGTPPVVTVVSPGENQRVASAIGYSVVISVTDDVGVREAPLLYYTTIAPENPSYPDVTTFDQTSFRETGAQWTATIPSLGLLPTEELTVYFVASVTDNDDSSGTACDHRTETPLRQFIASGSDQVQLTDDCGYCSDSRGCKSGICATSSSGGRCLAACGGGAGCSLGSCLSTTTVEGSSVDACGDVETVCEGGGQTCTDDAHEPNDTRTDAGPIYLGATNATLCAADPDYYRYETMFDTELGVTLSGFAFAAADLDLELLDSDGDRLGLSAGLGDTETVNYCVPAGDDVTIRVFSVSSSDQSAYTLNLTEASGDCCNNDPGEPDNTLGTANPIPLSDEFEGVICPSDRDHHSFMISEPVKLSAFLLFESSQGDLDLELYGPDGTLIDGSYEYGDEESLELVLCETGRYVLRVDIYGAGSTEYLGAIALDPLPSCSTTADCDIGTVCDGGTCACDSCDFDVECPTDHFCPIPGSTLESSSCAFECSTNDDCRDEGTLYESCKWFPEGRGCGISGSGVNGAACMDFGDCYGQRACIDWPGGYCARADCWTNADCETDTFCTDVDDLWLCVRKCGGSEPACRQSAGYICRFLTDVDGTEAGGCVPE